MDETNKTPENNQMSAKLQPLKRMVAMVPADVHKELAKMVIDRGANNLGEVITMLYKNYNQQAA